MTKNDLIVALEEASALGAQSLSIGKVIDLIKRLQSTTISVATREEILTSVELAIDRANEQDRLIDTGMFNEDVPILDISYMMECIGSVLDNYTDYNE